MQWYEILYHDNFKNTLIALGVFLVFLLFRKIFTTYIFKILMRFFQKAKTELFPQILVAFEKPMQWFFIVIGLYIAMFYFPYMEQNQPLFLKGVQASIILLLSWGFYNLTAATSVIFASLDKRTKLALDDILTPFISKALRFIIVAITATIVLEIFGYGISGFIAGLGLGGLAFALAAQDVLANFFGGVVILIEKPFTTGDWIVTPSVQGTVVDITFRSTKVRTLALEIVTIPNATLADEAITNSSRRDKRLVSFHLPLAYDTPSKKIRIVIDQIYQMLRTHPDIHQDTIYATFDQYGENGAEVYLYFFTKTTVWGEYLYVKDDVNLKMMEILEKEGVALAVPSRRLYTSPKRGEEDPFVTSQPSEEKDVQN